MNCHNGEKYLLKSIKSIRKQSYSNWELIFFDNASNDRSVSIAESFKDNRIKIFSSKRFLKLYEARNTAIKKAKGKYITFLDTDDWWINKKLREELNFLKKNNNVNILYSKFFIYNQKTKMKKISNNNIRSGMISKYLLKDYSIGILSVFLRRKIFKNNTFNKKYNIIGDFDFFTNLSLKYNFFTIDKPLAYYRVHDDNYSKKKIDEFISEMKFWMNKNKKKYENKNISLFHQKILLKKFQIKKILKYFKGV